MNVLVIGATGGTGRHAVRLLLERGHRVTAFVRTPAKVTEKNENLIVVQGEARDREGLERAMRGQAAVLCAFGPRSLKKDNLQEVLMRNLVEAMTKNGVRRIVNLSAWGAGNSYATASPAFKLFRALVLRHVYRDKERGEALLLGSDLDFVNVRPGLLLNRPARGNVRASIDGRGLAHAITREDVATFMVDQLTNDEWLRKSPLIGY
jgi:uncharacterized protein YbjT (DUF2867 family)